MTSVDFIFFASNKSKIGKPIFVMCEPPKIVILFTSIKIICCESNDNKKKKTKIGMWKM